VCVNRCLRYGRKFEAARMLARPASSGARVYETNRNDKQLAYLVSLFQELEPAADHFGPVEESCLVLPAPPGGVLLVEGPGEALQTLERELLGSQEPLCVGLWWGWRCFNPKLDFWPRASLVCLAWRGGLAVVDLLRLEASGEPGELRGKELVRRVLEAPQLLKVAHDLDRQALQVLQRGLVPHAQLVGDEAPQYPQLRPCLDLAVCSAFARRTRSGAAAAARLPPLCFDYLRLEICLAEAFGNLERRPLRLTQQHYGLSLAWCPLMVLRTLCASRALEPRDLQQLALQLGLPGQPERWDEQLRTRALAREPEEEEPQPLILGRYAENLLGDSEWCERLPRPDRGFDLQAALRPLQSLLPAALWQRAEPAVQQLFDKQQAHLELERLYSAYQAHQRARASG